jgi:hypothetical protein
MKNFERFEFVCCGNLLNTNQDRQATCPKCKKNYEVIFDATKIDLRTR